MKDNKNKRKAESGAEETHPGFKGFRWLEISLEQPGDSTKKNTQGKRSSSPSSSSASTTRYVYFKPKTTTAAASTQQQSDEEDDEDSTSRTLQVVNIPCFYTQEDVVDLFSIFGTVQACIFTSPSTALQAFVVQPAEVIFEREEDLRAAMTTDLTGMVQPFELGRQTRGVEKWKQQFALLRPEVGVLSSQVQRFMNAFDQRSEAEKAAYSQGDTTDADGWTTVRHAKKPRTVLLSEEKVNKGKSKKEKKVEETMQFYQFQNREQKKTKLADLRTKFEEDKRKIASLRATRKFEPFSSDN